jgi:hypothetical protein
MAIKPSPEVPPGLRGLYDAAGPILRYRILRDVMGCDTSFIQTATARLDIAKLEPVRALADLQQLDGSWSGSLLERPRKNGLSTESAFLRLCEWGLEDDNAAKACIEKALLPTLLDEDVIWEFETRAETDELRRAARQVVRDSVLRMLCRSTRDVDELLKPQIEILLTEWDHFLRHAESKSASTHEVLPPTEAGFSAVCWFPWDDDDFPRIEAFVHRLVVQAESRIGKPPAAPALFAPYVFALNDKVEFLAQPQELFFFLEHSARLGVTRDLDVTRWLLEELESRQDADGWFRFETLDPPAESWYYPLETPPSGERSVEWTFRAELIYRLLQFDL